MYHIENQLAEETGLSAADRRELEKQLRVLLNANAAARRKADALNQLHRLAPRAWELAQPAIKTLVTTEIAAHLR